MEIRTIPDGADIYIRDYADIEPDESQWRLLGRSPLKTDMIPQSYYPRVSYRIRAVKPGFEPVEWAVPLGSNLTRALTIELHTTESTPAGMVWVPGITELGTIQTNQPARLKKRLRSGWIETK